MSNNPKNINETIIQSCNDKTSSIICQNFGKFAQIEFPKNWKTRYSIAYSRIPDNSHNCDLHMVCFSINSIDFNVWIILQFCLIRTKFSRIFVRSIHVPLYIANIKPVNIKHEILNKMMDKIRILK